MQIIGCDLHAHQQTLAMLDTATDQTAQIRTVTAAGRRTRDQRRAGSSVLTNTAKFQVGG